MEKFNLEKYLANPSRKVVTRDGREARIICTDMNYKNHPIVAIIANDNDTENVYTYTKYGEWDNYGSTTYDLFFAPEKDKERVTVERFDPNTLKPYDKVLVRDCTIDNWVCDLFSHIEDKKRNEVKNRYPYYCVGNNYGCCIPYNDDTKHLLGTTELPSKYYRYWEE